jgi:hypothetical protein
VPFCPSDVDSISELLLGVGTILKSGAQPAKRFCVVTRTGFGVVVLEASRKLVGLIEDLLCASGHGRHLG